jgi:NAD(P) transhydrogenase subunit alpha
MKVGVPGETYPGERRVAVVPAGVPLLADRGVEVLVQEGAGESAGFTDDEYRRRGARIEADRAGLFRSSDVLLQVRGLGANPDRGRNDLALLRPGQALVAFLDPLAALGELRELAQTGVTAFAMELIPRIARAQSMDALSSMATIAGYKAVLLAADALPRIFPMLITAAGTTTPARVLVIGAGVAGLQAIATARRLGAVVQAYDIRPDVKQQVESLGARFVELPLEPGETEASGGYARAMDEEFYALQRELMGKVVSESDVVIATAAVMGGKAPILITGEMVRGMRPGSVIVDQAAESGGNCELTRPGETVVEHGVTIIGPMNLSSTVPYDASQMYGRNTVNFLLHLLKEGELNLDVGDDIVGATLISRSGEVVHPRVRELMGLPPNKAHDGQDVKEES